MSVPKEVLICIIQSIDPKKKRDLRILESVSRDFCSAVRALCKERRVLFQKVYHKLVEELRLQFGMSCMKMVFLKRETRFMDLTPEGSADRHYLAIWFGKRGIMVRYDVPAAHYAEGGQGLACFFLHFEPRNATSGTVRTRYMSRGRLSDPVVLGYCVEPFELLNQWHDVPWSLE